MARLDELMGKGSQGWPDAALALEADEQAAANALDKTKCIAASAQAALELARCPAKAMAEAVKAAKAEAAQAKPARGSHGKRGGRYQREKRERKAGVAEDVRAVLFELVEGVAVAVDRAEVEVAQATAASDNAACGVATVASSEQLATAAVGHDLEAANAPSSGVRVDATKGAPVEGEDRDTAHAGGVSISAMATCAAAALARCPPKARAEAEAAQRKPLKPRRSKRAGRQQREKLEQRAAVAAAEAAEGQTEAAAPEQSA